MTSIDDLFKRPTLPTKRKFENPSEADPTQAYKSAKLTSNGDAKRRAHAAVEDAPEDDDDEAGPSLPPDFEDQGLDDDEEGRFFGGGLDENATAAMNFLDKHDEEDTYVEQKYDMAWLKKFAVNFERKINKNAELRSKYADEPQKFMESEADLEDDIKQLSMLTEHAELYEKFAEHSAKSLVQLLGHDNTDIAIDAIYIVDELTDENTKTTPEQWDALVTAMVDADLLDLLFSNFSRFDESIEDDSRGVYHSLKVVQNLASGAKYRDLIGKETKMLSWLLKRIQKKESQITQNKDEASDALAVLLTESPSNRRRIISEDAVDTMLQLLAPYRKRDPPKDEENFAENIFNCLECLVDEAEGKTKFVEAEGVELCLIMLKEGKMSRRKALPILAHAVGYAELPPSDGANDPKRKSKSKGNERTDDDSNSNKGALVCDRLVEAGGLKLIFGMFAKRSDPRSIEHLINIFGSLLNFLPGDSPPRLRVLAKFMEKDYEKVDKLIMLRRQYASSVSEVEARIKEERKGLSEEEQEIMEQAFNSRRAFAGLPSLEMLDKILAWLIAEDSGAKKAIIKMLAERDEGLEDIRKALEEQAETADPKSREVLETLIGFL